MKLKERQSKKLTSRYHSQREVDWVGGQSANVLLYGCVLRMVRLASFVVFEIGYGTMHSKL